MLLCPHPELPEAGLYQRLPDLDVTPGRDPDAGEGPHVPGSPGQKNLPVTSLLNVSVILSITNHIASVLFGRPTQYSHHPNIDPPLPDVEWQSLSLPAGQLEDGAEWRMGQEDGRDR